MFPIARLLANAAIGADRGDRRARWSRDIAALVFWARSC